MTEKENVLKYLKKSGLPLEIDVTYQLLQNGWSVQNQSYYFDQNENKPRYVDIFANKLEEITFGQYNRINISLIIECKRTFDPWVFYTVPDPKNFTYLLKPLFSIQYNAIPPLETSQHNIFQQSHYMTKKNKKHSIISYQAFIKEKGGAKKKCV